MTLTLDWTAVATTAFSPVTLDELDAGQADAINKGFRMARGQILAWLNSDDAYIFRHTLDEVVAEFHRMPEADVIYGDAVLITLRDTGPGIAVEDADRLKRRGRRGRDSDGFGLGLAIVDQLCERLGWRLEIDNRHSGGCRARIANLSA
mgnify:CR=1 FL=1